MSALPTVGRDKMTKIVGITGGIASGKSLVSNYLAQLGYPIVDADIVAREVVAPNSKGLKCISAAFGSRVITNDGQLDRKRLGAIVFADDHQLKKLNDIMQPLIRQKIIQELDELTKENHTIIFLVAPLLFEQAYQAMCDEIMVVAVNHEVQLDRLMQRDGLTKEQANERISKQWPLSRKLKLADLVIDNDKGPEQTQAQVMNWLKRTIA